MSYARLDELVDAGGTSSTQLSLFLINKRLWERVSQFQYSKLSSEEPLLN